MHYQQAIHPPSCSGQEGLLSAGLLLVRHLLQQQQPPHHTDSAGKGKKKKKKRHVNDARVLLVVVGALVVGDMATHCARLARSTLPRNLANTTDDTVVCCASAAQPNPAVQE